MITLDSGKGFGFAIYNIGACSLVGLATVYSINDHPAVVYMIRSLLIVGGSVVTALALVLPKLVWSETATPSSRGPRKAFQNLSSGGSPHALDNVPSLPSIVVSEIGQSNSRSPVAGVVI